MKINYESQRLRSPKIKILGINSPLIWPLFYAHKKVIQESNLDKNINIEQYLECALWIQRLWQYPLIQDKENLFDKEQLNNCEKLLRVIPSDSIIKNVVLEIRKLQINAEKNKEFCQEILSIYNNLLDNYSSIIVIENKNNKCMLDFIDAHRLTKNLPKLNRRSNARENAPVEDENNVALLIGRPKGTHPYYNWALWPPIAPVILQVAWQPRIHDIKTWLPNIDEKLIWKWDITENVTEIIDKNGDLPEQVDTYIKSLSEIEPIKVRFKNGLIQKENIKKYKILNTNSYITDEATSDTACKPFVVCVNNDGSAELEEDLEINHVGSIYALARPIDFASHNDRKRVHSKPELIKFKNKLTKINNYREVINKISKYYGMTEENIRLNLKNWSSNELTKPYLPQNYNIFVILAEICGYSINDYKKLWNLIKQEVSKNLSNGFAESALWKKSIENLKLESQEIYQLKSKEIVVFVKLETEVIGELELIPIDQESEDLWQE